MTERTLCQACHKKPAAINCHKNNKTYYRKRCDSCSRMNRKIVPNWHLAGYKKKPVCERCGFKSRMPQQMAVHYIDGNTLNTSVLNLKSICLNCEVEIRKSGAVWKQGDLIPDY